MENDAIKKLGDIAEGFARKKGLNDELAKDFRQDYLLKYVVLNKNQSMTLELGSFIFQKLTMSSGLT